MTVYAHIPHREPVDPGPGEHLWITTVAFKVPDKIARDMAEGRDADQVLLDHENVICPPAIGCYKCEERFSRRLYFRKCTGQIDPL